MVLLLTFLSTSQLFIQFKWTSVQDGLHQHPLLKYPWLQSGHTLPTVNFQILPILSAFSCISLWSHQLLSKYLQRNALGFFLNRYRWKREADNMLLVIIFRYHDEIAQKQYYNLTENKTPIYCFQFTGKVIFSPRLKMFMQFWKILISPSTENHIRKTYYKQQ